MILIKINNIKIPVVKDDEKNEITFIISNKVKFPPELIFRVYVEETNQTIFDIAEYRLFIHTIEEAAVRWCKINMPLKQLNEEQYQLAAVGIFKEKFNL